MPAGEMRWASSYAPVDVAVEAGVLAPVLAPADGLIIAEFDVRCAGHVLMEGNTLLGSVELEMLVVLRMNREFMKYMRQHYNHLTSDHFGQTVVEP